METSRLGALALMNIHYDHKIDYNQVADLFFQLFLRKLEKENLIFDIEWELKEILIIVGICHLIDRFSLYKICVP